MRLDPDGTWDDITMVSPLAPRYCGWRDVGIWAVLLSVPVTGGLIWLFG